MSRLFLLFSKNRSKSLFTQNKSVTFRFARRYFRSKHQRKAFLWCFARLFVEQGTGPRSFRCIFNSLEFGGIKIRIIHGLPNSEELDGVLVTEPLLNKCQPVFYITHHVCERKSKTPRRTVLIPKSISVSKRNLNSFSSLPVRGHWGQVMK